MKLMLLGIALSLSFSALAQDTRTIVCNGDAVTPDVEVVVVDGPMGENSITLTEAGKRLASITTGVDCGLVTTQAYYRHSDPPFKILRVVADYTGCAKPSNVTIELQINESSPQMYARMVLARAGEEDRAVYLQCTEQN